MYTPMSTVIPFKRNGTMLSELPPPLPGQSRIVGDRYNPNSEYVLPGRAEQQMRRRALELSRMKQPLPHERVLVDGDNPKALINKPVKDIAYDDMPVAATLHAGQGTVVWLGGVPQPTGKEVLENPRRQMAAFILAQIMRVNEGQPAGPVAMKVDGRSVAHAAFVGAVAEKYPSPEYPGMNRRSHAMREVLGFVDDVVADRVSVQGKRENAQAVWDSFDEILGVMKRLNITPYDLYSVALERKQDKPAPFASPHWLKPGYDEARDHRRPLPKHAKPSLLGRVRGWLGGKADEGFDWVPEAGR